MVNNYFKAGLVIAILGIVGFVYGWQTMTTIVCTGVQVLNPFCWLGQTANFITGGFWLVVGSLIMFAGLILLTVKDNDQFKLYLWFAAALIATVVLWIVPDPIPFVDEIIMPIVTLYLGIRTMVHNDTNNGVIF
jgi:hypothetical protein